MISLLLQPQQLHIFTASIFLVSALQFSKLSILPKNKIKIENHCSGQSFKKGS